MKDETVAESAIPKLELNPFLKFVLGLGQEPEKEEGESEIQF